MSRRTSFHRSGFSLLELAIVLVIVALLVSGGLTLTTAKVQQNQIENTMDEMEEIRTALQVYLAEYGRLPCPASITLTSGNALYGRSATDCSDATPPTGLTRVQYPAASGQYVRIGGVPFYTLGLPEKYLADAHNNRYLYAVQEAAITSLTTSSTGNIQILDNSGAQIVNDAVMVLISPGRSHKGAYAARTGVTIAVCNAANKDGENCDDDGIFTDATFNDGNIAANFFDDLVLWDRRASLFGVTSSGSSSSSGSSTSSGASSSSSSSSSSGGFNPWKLNNLNSSINTTYPLVYAGSTTATFKGNAGITAMNNACMTKFPGSWMMRSQDVIYISPQDRNTIPINLRVIRTHKGVYISAGYGTVETNFDYDYTPSGNCVSYLYSSDNESQQFTSNLSQEPDGTYAYSYLTYNSTPPTGVTSVFGISKNRECNTSYKAACVKER